LNELVTNSLAISGLGFLNVSFPERKLASVTQPRPTPQLDLVSDLSVLADEDLMLRYRGGQGAAFDVLVLRHRRRIYSFLLRRLREPTLAEEILSEVFLKLHRAAPRYKPQAKFTTYLFTIAYRASLNAQARQRNQRDEGVGGLDELEAVGGSRERSSSGRNPDRALRGQRAIQRLEQELQLLPEGQQAAFVLYYREGLSVAEVADCLDLRPAEVKGRLAYARKLLRTRMADFLAEGGGDL
jgi:RNA polymerase sigma-70 factor (ECF subfamily)